MSNIKLNLKKNVAYIKIDNVLTKNSLDRNDLKRITDFLIKICNQNLTCLVISSSGDIFSSGMNLKELSVGDWSKNPISEVCDLIENLPFVSICHINGPIYGGSVELAISNDFRIGSENCKIQIPASKYGIHYGYKGIKRCIDFFGLQTSKKLLFLGEPLYFEDLKKINFFDYYDNRFENSKKILSEKIKKLSLLSYDSIKNMKASINDYKNNNINIKVETERFLSGFKSGLILDKINDLKKNR